MTPQSTVTGVFSSLLLIVFGLVPGLFGNIVHALRNFQNEISATTRQVEYQPVQQPVVLAWVGAALLVFVVLTRIWV